ncbi:unannotated protein [freshwater metagenome]|uniref:Unannotated protein n=1 Tax=freshwater metagenome TaxID=449393 RepID=A0A6J6JNW5_9ZZZZ
MSDNWHSGHQVPGPHTGSQQRLVRVAECGLCDRQGLLFTQGPSKSDRAQRVQQLLGPSRWSVERNRRELRGGVAESLAGPVGLIDSCVGQPCQKLCPTVLGHSSPNQLRALIDERGRDVAGEKRFVLNHSLQKSDVGGDSANPELGQTAPRAGHGGREIAATRCHLRQQ